MIYLVLYFGRFWLECQVEFVFYILLVFAILDTLLVSGFK